MSVFMKSEERTVKFDVSACDREEWTVKFGVSECDREEWTVKSRPNVGFYAVGINFKKHFVISPTAFKLMNFLSTYFL